jgi:hypothetical protein
LIDPGSPPDCGDPSRHAVLRAAGDRRHRRADSRQGSVRRGLVQRRCCMLSEEWMLVYIFK